MSAPILVLDSKSPFFWRNSSINGGVSFWSDSKIAPFDSFNGKVDGWSFNTYMTPSSYPSNCGPIFSRIRQMERDEYYKIKQTDDYGFYWKCSEDEARAFMKENYPSLYQIYLETYCTV
jgi:hypothetical protein